MIPVIMPARRRGVKHFAAGKILKRAEFTSGRLSQMRGPCKTLFCGDMIKCDLFMYGNV